MLGHRALKLPDYLGILKRRILLIACCVVVLTFAIGGLSYFLKPVYESQTLILIQRQRIPEDYVKPIVAEDLDARLSSMKEQILSRSRLEPIINRYSLFAGGKATIDDRIEMTRKAISIKQIAASEGHGGMPGFYISFDAHDARTAQLVCGEITSLFVNANLNAQEQSAEGTTEFLRQQVKDAKTALDEQDAKLAAFQEKYLGRLPDDSNANTGTLQSLTTQLDTVSQSITQMQQNEAFLRSMIAQHRPQSVDGDGPVIDIDVRQKELQSLMEQKKQLETQYTADYPDVVAVKRKIADLQAEMNRATAAPPAQAPPSSTKDLKPIPHSDSPELNQLQAQLRAAESALTLARQEQSRLQKKIQVYENRIEQSPMVEQEYKQITRDHESAVQFYNSLLAKMNESSMAAALQLRQEGEQFTVMDPPNLPDSPKFPKHALFAGFGFAAGLGLGVLISAYLEFRDKAIRSETDIFEFTGLPTLGVICEVDGLPEEKRPSSRRKKRAGSLQVLRGGAES